jgi:dienelactone hydrolase
MTRSGTRFAAGPAISRPTERLAGGFLFLLGTALVLGACTTGSAPTTRPAAASSQAATATSRPSQSPVPTPVPSPDSVSVVRDVPFESESDILAPGLLDVYVPTEGGAWPTVVMLHGDPSAATKSYLSRYADAVAAEGYLVYVPTWGQSGGDAYHGASVTEQLVADGEQAACAVEFARSDAATRGGGTQLILFGHSAGGNIAAQVAFGRPPPSAGCLGDRSLGTIDALVTWEGDWLLGDPSWDSVLAEDPAPFDVITPWSHLSDRTDMKVVMLVTDNTLNRPMSDAAAVDAFLAARDPTGALRPVLAAEGAFDDGVFGLDEEQTLLYDVLKAQGNPVTLDVMSGSSHEHVGDEGWPVFLNAFRRAATPA